MNIKTLDKYCKDHNKIIILHRNKLKGVVNEKIF